MAQRLFDILLSCTALLVLSPWLVLIAIILRLTGEGEVFFRQDRIGRGGRIFKLWKFATMLKNSPDLSTGTLTVRNDPRILPMGRFLRRTKMNELPQLLNILIGDMSFVGPRPLTRQTFAAYAPDVQATVSKVRPGLSGVGSIIFRNEEEILSGGDGSLEFYKQVISPYKGALEEWFVENRGLYVYFAAIIATVVVVLKPDSPLPWRIFKGLPSPPPELQEVLHFTGRAVDRRARHSKRVAHPEGQGPAPIPAWGNAPGRRHQKNLKA